MQSVSQRNKEPGTERISHILTRKTATVLFCAVAVVWLLIDRLSKAALDSYVVHDLIASNVLGLFEFRLAHNTGAAWSILSDSTLALGVFSVLVCVALTLYLFVLRKGRANVLEVLGIALVVSGGLGNAFDRFVYGYVVDFINATFINFPIFNVADIGVTCGVVIFMVGTLIGIRDDLGGGETEDAPIDSDQGR